MSAPAFTFWKTDVPRAFYLCHVIERHLTPHVPSRFTGQVGVHDYLKFLTTNYCKICPSTHVFTCGFNTTVLHHITAIKYVNGCPKIIPVVDVKFKFPGLHVHPTLILSFFFSVRIFKNQGPCQYNWYHRGAVASNSTIYKWNKDYTRNRCTLASFFLTQNSVVFVNMGANSNNFCKKIKIARLLTALLFVLFLYTVHYTYQVLWRDHWSWSR
jgi:hypothetical protein